MRFFLSRDARAMGVDEKAREGAEGRGGRAHRDDEAMEVRNPVTKDMLSR